MQLQEIKKQLEKELQGIGVEVTTKDSNIYIRTGLQIRHQMTLDKLAANVLTEKMLSYITQQIRREFDHQLLKHYSQQSISRIMPGMALVSENYPEKQWRVLQVNNDGFTIVESSHFTASHHWVPTFFERKWVEEYLKPDLSDPVTYLILQQIG